jgi:hypothetical protein
VISAGETGTAYVTLTVPAATAVRAVAAIFRCRTVLETASGIAMTGSLGSLVTFDLSDGHRVDAEDLDVAAQSATKHASVSAWLSNTGTEPVIPAGTLAVLDAAGALVGKAPIAGQRLLPGERLRFSAEYPALLDAGRYRAVFSVQYEQKVLTRAQEFTVGPGFDAPRPAAPPSDRRR